MMTDEELMNKIDEVSGEFKGQIDHFYEAVGMIVVGRLYGWEFMRLASSRRCWSTATRLFGDPKLLMPQRAKYTHKSFALGLIDDAKDYWEIIRGHKPMPMDQRRITS